MALATGVLFVLFLLLIGLVLIWLVGTVWLIFTLIAASKQTMASTIGTPL